ncbi:conserved hypothetical protein [Neospora caninum Liverpool]|uniref:Transmembrane protein n=1 Tax=Neospora caninum (strain Liverpool) TaxID=572307 RepID=F0VPD6_NEOCL|nr:conserved hypothetical protein [Neospora caninum Liverpool]CBZ55582.1 conserved hypothetical protein [Neospora caninum Liverpool]CEL70324.1 TPA: hypothetical protein BN1204_060060 [Neospora caninum Liverpool]|eukprot:XP_003885610.1 conserved hypothetical protein [Neospora caninum Liverpool]
MVTGGVWRPNSLPLYSRGGGASSPSGELPRYSRSSSDGQHKLGNSRSGHATSRKKGKRRRRLSRIGRFVVLILLLLLALWLVVLWRWAAVPAGSPQSGDVHVLVDQEPTPGASPHGSAAASAAASGESEGERGSQNHGERMKETVPTVHKSSAIKPEPAAPVSTGEEAARPAPSRDGATSSSSPPPLSQEPSVSQDETGGTPGTAEETKKSSDRGNGPPQTRADTDSPPPPALSQSQDTQTATPKPDVAATAPASERAFSTARSVPVEKGIASDAKDAEVRAVNRGGSVESTRASERKASPQNAPAEESPERKSPLVEQRDKPEAQSGAPGGSQQGEADTDHVDTVGSVSVKQASSGADANRQEEIRDAAGVRRRPTDGALASEKRVQSVAATDQAVDASRSRQTWNRRDPAQDGRPTGESAHEPRAGGERASLSPLKTTRVAASRGEVEVPQIRPQGRERVVHAAKVEPAVSWGRERPESVEEDSEEDFLPDWQSPVDARGRPMAEGPGAQDARRPYRTHAQAQGRMGEVSWQRWSPVFSEDSHLPVAELKRASRGGSIAAFHGHGSVGVLTEGAFGPGQRPERPFASKGTASLPETRSADRRFSRWGRVDEEARPEGQRESYDPEEAPELVGFRSGPSSGFVRNAAQEREAMQRAAHAFWAPHPENVGVVRREHAWREGAQVRAEDAPFYRGLPRFPEDEDTRPWRQGEVAQPVARAHRRVNLDPVDRQREAPSKVEEETSQGNPRTRKGDGIKPNVRGRKKGYLENGSRAQVWSALSDARVDSEKLE